MPKIVFRHNDSGKTLYEVEGITLHGVSLSGVNLSGAAMYAIERIDSQPQVNPIWSLSFRKASVSGLDLSQADLSGAVFSEESVTGVNFSDADLDGAVFVRSLLIRCNLDRANLANARLMNTAFINCRSLHKALGLDQLEHAGP